MSCSERLAAAVLLRENAGMSQHQSGLLTVSPPSSIDVIETYVNDEVRVEAVCLWYAADSRRAAV